MESKMEEFQKINSGIDKKIEEVQIAFINQSATFMKETEMDKKFEEFQKQSLLNQLQFRNKLRY